MIPFGPQLIGQTEKALNALLQTVLAGRDLTEREWVALRLASQFDGTPDLDGFVAERLHAPDAGRLTAALRDRGFLTDAALTPEGSALVAEIGQDIAALTAPLWREIEGEDAEVATRVLNLVLERSLTLLRTAGR
ncbi:hypothetical protein [Microbacterium sp. Se5.02b]|uniref:hypothetical protein n=1 Tax=Microbacterium sp. Se5.02b TaxID=2864103 RepID=UPI001C689144|nr:hypothetical protein [Microbacterium sp. Se5.02b]QYM64191.1 hypothetical protein K1X59_19345 [Microbacterium sp. Se5.02b]